MRLLKIMLIALMVSAVAVPSVSCSSKTSPESAPMSQLVAVQRGGLTVDIAASGNLALSQTEDLAFEISGTVEEVTVAEGDSVEKDQVLANLDTSAWEEQLKALEQQLIAAERNLTTKERAVTTAGRQVAAKERAVTTAERQVTAKELALAAAERQVTAKELALRQAQLNLQTAEYNLGQIADVKKAQDAVDDAENDLKIAQAMWEAAMKSSPPDAAEVDYWRKQISSGDPTVPGAKERLAQAQQQLKEVLAGSSVKVTTTVALDVASKNLQVEQTRRQVDDARIAIDDARVAVEDARIAVENAKVAVEDAKTAVDDAKTAVDDAKIAVDDAQKGVDDAQKTLDEAKSLSPVIKAPFAGFVTKVNVKGGDDILKGTVAVQIADPNKFEASILVSEKDIMQLKIDGEAQVQVDAVSGMSLPAKVTHIAPTATIQQGVVNYKVKVEVQSVQAITQEHQAARQEATQRIQQGELPERLRQAIQEGRITQEQAEEMMKQRQQGQGAQQSQMPAMSSGNLQLREGLTATVSIIVEQKSDILLVPNTAITRQGTKSYVKVSKEGSTEEREIKTGISNWQYTEVTEGLSEGEQVVVTQGTATTSTTQQRQGQPGGMFIPGVGGIR